MKELSIEQKAKAYNEALDRARKLQENSKGMILKKWLWNIFPELKESKDLEKEIKLYRMRNPIIGHREESLYNYMSNVAKYFFELGLKAQKGE